MVVDLLQGGPANQVSSRSFYIQVIQGRGAWPDLPAKISQLLVLYAGAVCDVVAHMFLRKFDLDWIKIGHNRAPSSFPPFAFQSGS
jgi:hypothetical protein